MHILLPSGWVLFYDALLLMLLYLTGQPWRSPTAPTAPTASTSPTLPSVPTAPAAPVSWLWGVLLLAGGIIQGTDWQLAQCPDSGLEAVWPIGAAIVPNIVPNIVTGILPITVPIYVAWQLGRRSATTSGPSEPRSLPNGAQILAEMVPVSIFMYQGLQL
ncbi:MAG TPA: hypothetical protein V6C88_03415, partial [Chroococcidiopsis sp.]